MTTLKQIFKKRPGTSSNQDLRDLLLVKDWLQQFPADTFIDELIEDIEESVK